MLSLDEITDDLRLRMSEHRFDHTLGVIETSEKLAQYYGYDTFKAKMAAALHDCSKTLDITAEQMRDIAERTIFKDKYPEQLNGANLLHAVASEVIAREKYGVQDRDILSAVRWHTTGCDNMSGLDMIVYSADMVEPARNFNGADRLRAFMYTSLERLTYECCAHTVAYLKTNNMDIHMSTMDTYLYLKGKINGNEFN